MAAKKKARTTLKHAIIIGTTCFKQNSLGPTLSHMVYLCVSYDSYNKQNLCLLP